MKITPKSDPFDATPQPTAPARRGIVVDGIPLGQFALRVAWVAARIVAVAYLGSSGATFFYQGF